MRFNAFPLLPRKTWNVKQSVVSPRLNRGSGGLRGFHRLPSLFVGVGFIVFWVFVGLWRGKLLTYRHPSWYKHAVPALAGQELQWENTLWPPDSCRHSAHGAFANSLGTTRASNPVVPKSNLGSKSNASLQVPAQAPKELKQGSAGRADSLPFNPDD